MRPDAALRVDTHDGWAKAAHRPVRSIVRVLVVLFAVASCTSSSQEQQQAASGPPSRGSAQDSKAALCRPLATSGLRLVAAFPTTVGVVRARPVGPVSANRAGPASSAWRTLDSGQEAAWCYLDSGAGERFVYAATLDAEPVRFIQSNQSLPLDPNGPRIP